MKHLCHADGCTREVPPSLVMCGPHWRSVPRHLQRELWAQYRRGQESDKRPSARYLITQEVCVCAVAVAEGLITHAEAAERIAARERDAEAMAQALPVAHQLGLI